MTKTMLRCLPWVVSLAACGSSGTKTAADAGPDAGTGVTGSGSVFGYASAADVAGSKPLLGVAVCVLDHAEVPCVMSDLLGRYVLPGIPANADIAISFTKTGYYGMLLPTHSPSVDFKVNSASAPAMTADAYEAQFFASAGWTYPAADKGVFHAHVVSGTSTSSCTGLGQTTFAASTGVAPVYTKACPAGQPDQNGPGSADLTLTASTTTGDGFFLAASDSVNVTATHATLTCSSAFDGWGWASTTPGTVSAPVRPGYETLVLQKCN